VAVPQLKRVTLEAFSKHVNSLELRVASKVVEHLKSQSQKYMRDKKVTVKWGNGQVTSVAVF
jgi:hypothetical protein